MPGAVRFLYGLALGISLGIIGARLMRSASSGHGRYYRHDRRPRPAARARADKQKVTTR